MQNVSYSVTAIYSSVYDCSSLRPERFVCGRRVAGDSGEEWQSRESFHPGGRSHEAVTVTIPHPSIRKSPDVIGQSLPVFSFPLPFLDRVRL